MELTRDELQSIEQALEIARDNTGDEEWSNELAEVLNKVRSMLNAHQSK